MFCAAACCVTAARAVIEVAHFIVTEVVFDCDLAQVKEVVHNTKVTMNNRETAQQVKRNMYYGGTL